MAEKKTTVWNKVYSGPATNEMKVEEDDEVMIVFDTATPSTLKVNQQQNQQKDSSSSSSTTSTVPVIVKGIVPVIKNTIDKSPSHSSAPTNNPSPGLVTAAILPIITDLAEDIEMMDTFLPNPKSPKFINTNLKALVSVCSGGVATIGTENKDIENKDQSSVSNTQVEGNPDKTKIPNEISSEHLKSSQEIVVVENNEDNQSNPPDSDHEVQLVEETPVAQNSEIMSKSSEAEKNAQKPLDLSASPVDLGMNGNNPTVEIFSSEQNEQRTEAVDIPVTQALTQAVVTVTTDKAAMVEVLKTSPSEIENLKVSNPEIIEASTKEQEPQQMSIDQEKKVVAEDLSIVDVTVEEIPLKEAAAVVVHIENDVKVKLPETSTTATTSVVEIPIELNLTKEVAKPLIAEKELVAEDLSKKRKLLTDDQQQAVNPNANKRAKCENLNNPYPEVINLDDEGEEKSGFDFDAYEKENELDDHTECREMHELLFSEIDYLRGKNDRMLERQMLIEDFALVEFGSKFRTFFHARDRLLEMGKQQIAVNQAHVLAPGSSYLISILKFINNKAEASEEAGEELNLNDEDINKIEAAFQTSKNSSETGNKKSAPLSETVTSAMRSGALDGQRPSSSTQINQTMKTSPRRTSLDMLKNPLFQSTPTRSIASSISSSTQRINSAGNPDSKPNLGSGYNNNTTCPSSPGNLSRISDTSSIGTSTKRPKAKGQRKKICGICGSQYLRMDLKTHVNQHAGIVFKCSAAASVCDVEHYNVEKAQMCAKIHRLKLFKKFHVKSYLKKANGILQELDQSDVNRIQATTANAVTANATWGHTKISPNSANNQPCVPRTHQMIHQDRGMIYQQGVQRQEMMHEQSVQRHHISPTQTGGNGSETKDLLIERQRLQQQNILRQQKKIREDALRQQMIRRQNIRQQQQQSSSSSSVFQTGCGNGGGPFASSSAPPASRGPSTSTIGGGNSMMTERPGYFTTGFVNDQQGGNSHNYNGSRTSGAYERKMKRARDREKKVSMERLGQGQFQQAPVARSPPPQQGSGAYEGYSSYAEYAQSFLKGNPYRR